MFDYLIVGAGFSGAVLAERLASQLGKRVLVIDRRNHIGGNAFDHYDANGVLVHRYRHHVFHTNSDRVFAYLSQFTDWRPYEHRVLSAVDGHLVPIPLNRTALSTLSGLGLECSVEDAEPEGAAPLGAIRTAEDAVVARVGRAVYERLFREDLRKRWGADPSELDPAAAADIVVRPSDEDRASEDKHQVAPSQGFTRMFERMLAHPNIKVLLQADYREVRREVRCDKLIYTGAIDEFFDHLYGKLPYRATRLEFETYPCEALQPAAVVHHPDARDYTRIIEFKHLTGQQHPSTTVAYEYARAQGEPYAPIPRPQNRDLYRKYKTLADATPNAYFVGRLATYRALPIDQSVAEALAKFDQIRQEVRAGVSKTVARAA